MTKPSRAHLPLVFGLFMAASALAGCSPSDETPAGHSSADRAEGHSSSSAGLPAGHAEAGQKLATTKNPESGQSCVDCHGAAGNAPIAPIYPKIGGQYHDYLAHSLQMYRDGDRDNAMMAMQAKKLTDQQIADLAAYFSVQPSLLRDLHGLD
jgi:cytochrome c553